jgi:hypothetical protein
MNQQPQTDVMSLFELRNELRTLNLELGGQAASKLRRADIERVLPMFRRMVEEKKATPLIEAKRGQFPPREVQTVVAENEEISIPVIKERMTKAKIAKKIEITDSDGEPSIINTGTGKTEAPVAPVAPAKPKRVLSAEQLAKMAAGRLKLKQARDAAAAGVAAPKAEKEVAPVKKEPVVKKEKPVAKEKPVPKEKPIPKEKPVAVVVATKLPNGCRPI